MERLRINRINTAGSLGIQPVQPATQDTGTPCRLENLDFTDAHAVQQAYQHAVQLPALVQFHGWALRSGDQTVTVEALVTLMFYQHADAFGLPPEHIPGTRPDAVRKVAAQLSPSGLDALRRSVAEVPEANEFSEFLSAQDRCCRVGEGHRRRAASCELRRLRSVSGRPARRATGRPMPRACPTRLHDGPRDV
ncbi:hypothetical protein [Pandoraea sputorum]|uniref:Uncharacterized protein n=1 Tax=Pandoraea sputorum TaxID=93222 RepID=A0A5E5BEU6_9BURK|nr:hypothetical protein [Pandoraea sputorum]VVE84419.1 hypothetical protein PSP31121_04753 [Pandoraea sputorum]